MTRLALLPLSFLALAACTPQSGTGPARSTGLPFDVNNREVETPNSLPPGFTTSNPIAPSSGVLGVTRTAP
jgi:hypothetical protein